MSSKVIRYIDENPQATMKDVIKYFAEETQADEHLHNLNAETDAVLEIREKMRPFYASKSDLEVKMALIDSDLDMEVMEEYPTGKGSDAKRKVYKAKLQNEHDQYPELVKELSEVKETLKGMEVEMDDVIQKAKNARVALELFNRMAAFIVAYFGQSIVIDTTKAYKDVANADVF